MRVVQEVRDDHTARGRAAVQVLPRGQLPAAPPRQLRLRDRARLRLGLPRPVRARPLQLLAGQVHQVLLLRHLLLPEQGGTRVAMFALGFVSRFAVVYGFGKPGKSAAAAAATLTTQGEMCTTITKKLLGNNS